MTILQDIKRNDLDVEIQKLWIVLMTKRINQKSLPIWFRDEMLKSFLYQSHWTNPKSSNFQNLDVFSEFLKSVSMWVEGGHILLLNFIFQNIVVHEWKEEAEDDKIEDNKTFLTKDSTKTNQLGDTFTKPKIVLGNRGFASYKQVAETLEQCLQNADEQLSMNWEQNPLIEKVLLKVGLTFLLCCELL